jgi:hypothetical protein
MEIPWRILPSCWESVNDYLGNAFYADASAAIVVDEQLVAKEEGD